MESLRKLRPEWHLNLLLGEDGPFAARAARLGIGVQILPFPRVFARLGCSTGIGLTWVRKAIGSAGAVLRYRHELSETMRDICPDVIHANGLKMHLLTSSISRRGAGNCGVRVCHVHDYVSRRPMARSLLKAGVGRFDRVVANSNSVAADLLTLPVPRQRLSAIYNGVQLERFTSSGEKLDLDGLSGLAEPRAGVVRVGLVANFAKWKGHITFMRALALLPESLNVRAYVIGGPVYQTSGSQHTFDELREAAKKYCPGVQLGFTGAVMAPEAAFRALDIVVHASTAPEPFGMVIIEAMACGKAVIVSNGGGACEIFEDGVTALAHQPGDPVMLAGQIERLASDAGLRLRLGKNSREAVAGRFPADAMGTRFADLYCSLVDGREAGAYAGEEGGKKCFA
jgi:glycosyltransferase involved in cell wall biosynthesis